MDKHGQSIIESITHLQMHLSITYFKLNFQCHKSKYFENLKTAVLLL